MKLRWYIGLAVLLLCVAAPDLMRADITFISQAGLPLISNTCDARNGANATDPLLGGCPTTSVAIQPHSAWAPTTGLGGAVWISNDDSGYQGKNFQPPHDSLWPSGGGTGPTQAIFSLSLGFTVVSPGAKMTINAWADDTAGIYLDGAELWKPLLDQNSTCSGGIIGCMPAQGLTNYVVPTNYPATSLALGFHSLRFDSYQVGTGTNTTDNPFGLLFKVDVTNAVVPDGGVTLMLLGGVLVGLETLRRKIRA